MKISIEGVPGSGKTTILRILEKMGYNCYMEGEHHGNKDDILASVSQGDENGVRAGSKLIESSPYVLKRLWAHLNTKNPSVTNVTNSILLADWTPDYIIFLDCQPDICIKRLLTMGRNEGTTELFKQDGKSTNLSALQVTELYLQLEWILHPVNCDIQIYRVNASGSILHTLHSVLSALNTILGRNQESMNRNQSTGSV